MKESKSKLKVYVVRFEGKVWKTMKVKAASSEEAGEKAIDMFDSVPVDSEDPDWCEGVAGWEDVSETRF